MPEIRTNVPQQIKQGLEQLGEMVSTKKNDGNKPNLTISNVEGAGDGKMTVDYELPPPTANVYDIGSQAAKANLLVMQVLSKNMADTLNEVRANSSKAGMDVAVGAGEMQRKSSEKSANAMLMRAIGTGISSGVALATSAAGAKGLTKAASALPPKPTVPNPTVPAASLGPQSGSQAIGGAPGQVNQLPQQQAGVGQAKPPQVVKQDAVNVQQKYLVDSNAPEVSNPVGGRPRSNAVTEAPSNKPPQQVEMSEPQKMEFNLRLQESQLEQAKVQNLQARGNAAGGLADAAGQGLASMEERKKGKFDELATVFNAASGQMQSKASECGEALQTLIRVEDEVRKAINAQGRLGDQ